MPEVQVLPIDEAKGFPQRQRAVIGGGAYDLTLRFNPFETPKALILTVEDVPGGNTLYSSKVPEKAAFEVRAHTTKEALFALLANRAEEGEVDIWVYG